MMMELVLRDFCQAYGMHGIALRYFNPIGADPQMRSGLHDQNPSHVVAKMVEVQLGRLPEFVITGTDYATRDGTGIRDYIHIWDLVRAHINAVTDFDAVFERAGNPAENYVVINLGSGNGVTVRELVTAFESVIGHPINKREGPRRPGDAAGAYANADLAARLLNWKTELSIEQGIADALKWGQVRDTILHYS
jgi:UDP-glucose 4-epimerase